MQEQRAAAQHMDPFATLTEGRMVHFVLPDGKTHRPAIVVRVWDTTTNGLVNLQVFLDGTNDRIDKTNAQWITQEVTARGVMWSTSVKYDATGKEPHTWHWPERAG
jgi:hypothetical protein